jgi:protein-tyrosine-phosphatase
MVERTSTGRPLRLLFLCTANSARSQIAEALLNARRDPRIEAGSAGTHPAPAVNPGAIEVLRAYGIDVSVARPKTIEDVSGERWDIVITVCDSAREHCPVFPGKPVMAHWGIADPAAAPEPVKRRAFEDAARVLNRRIELLLALPLDKLEALALERELAQIATAHGTPEGASA